MARHSRVYSSITVSSRSERPLAGRTALVTGSSRGLGRVIALELARAGADVVVHFNQSDDLAERVAGEVRDVGTRALIVQGDVTDSGSTHGIAREALALSGSVDILVHNARVYDDRPLIETPPSRWQEAINASATALLLLAQDLAPSMRQNGWGRIIAISAQDAAVRDRGSHGLTKALLVTMCEALALELAPDVTVNTISPGLIADNEGLGDEARQDAIARTPLRQLVTRMDVAEALVTLCTKPFDTFTGQDIRLDGGRVIPQLFPPPPTT